MIFYIINPMEHKIPIKVKIGITSFDRVVHVIRIGFIQLWPPRIINPALVVLNTTLITAYFIITIIFCYRHPKKAKKKICCKICCTLF